MAVYFELETTVDDLGDVDMVVACALLLIVGNFFVEIAALNFLGQSLWKQQFPD
jgi:hypothetical protein